MIFVLIIMLFLLGGAHYYLARRFHQCIGFLIPKIPAGIYTGVLLFLAFLMILGFARSFLPLPVTLRNILGIISSYWMGIFIYLFLFFVLADIVLVTGRLIRAVPEPMPQKIRFISGLTVIILTLATVAYGTWHAGQIRHVSYKIPVRSPASVPELNIVMLSDLHIGAVHSENRIADIVNRINELKPDLVCIAGDIFDNDYSAIQHPDQVSRLLKNITSVYGVYACLGNHDAGDTLSDMLEFLARSDIKVLNDEYEIIDSRLVLAGRLDAAPIGGYGTMNRSDLSEILSGAKPDLPVVVMDHNPANIDEYGSEADLILSGHTHRGQIFPGSLFTKAIFTVDYGHYQKDKSSPHVVVTSGAGTWGLPMRVGTDSEIVSIKLCGPGEKE